MFRAASILIIFGRYDLLPDFPRHALRVELLGHRKPHRDGLVLLIFKKPFGSSFAVDQISEGRTNMTIGLGSSSSVSSCQIPVFQIIDVVLEPLSHPMTGHGGFDDLDKANSARDVILGLNRLFEYQLRPDEARLAQEMIVVL